MKTVPYLYPERQERTIFNDKEVPINIELSKEMKGRKQEFTDLFNQDTRFRFMKIHTDLLKESGINRNDITVIDPEEVPVTGKIIVVKVDDTLMIRRYEKMKNGFLLHADAQKVSPLKIEYGYNNVEIIGVVTFIIKSL